MPAELIIASETEQDVDEAYSWYEDHRQGLREEFLTCEDASLLFRQFVVLLNSTRKFTRSTVGFW